MKSNRLTLKTHIAVSRTACKFVGASYRDVVKHELSKYDIKQAQRNYEAVK